MTDSLLDLARSLEYAAEDIADGKGSDAFGAVERVAQALREMMAEKSSIPETGIRKVPEITAEMENWRGETIGHDGVRRWTRARRDPVKPVPEGTIVAMVFRVTGYDADCDGSLMARLDHLSRDADEGWSESGWSPNALGLRPTSDWVLDDPGVLDRLAGPATITPTLAPELANGWTRSDGRMGGAG